MLNKIIFLCAGHDSGKYVILNFLKNHPDIYTCDHIGDLFRKNQNKLNKVLKSIQKDRDCSNLISDINFDLLKEKNILLLTWHFITDIINHIDVFPIFIFRDIRVGWLVTEHKKYGLSHYHNMEIDQYIEKQLSIFKIFKDLTSEKFIPYYKFEDFLIDKRLAYTNLCFILNITANLSIIPSDFKEKNQYVSMFDVEKIFKFRQKVTDDELEYISSKTKEFNSFFNYPLSLTKEQILEG